MPAILLGSIGRQEKKAALGTGRRDKLVDLFHGSGLRHSRTGAELCPEHSHEHVAFLDELVVQDGLRRIPDCGAACVSHFAGMKMPQRQTSGV